MADLGLIGTVNRRSAINPGYVISGNVIDPLGLPAARQILIIKRGDPVQIERIVSSSPSTGAYTVMLPDTAERCVLALGADGGTENALVTDRITPF